MPAATDSKPSSSHTPIIVDLGRKRRKQIKRLRKGGGKLLDEVTDTIQELRTAGTISSNAEPVILLVREKRKGKMGLFPGF